MTQLKIKHYLGKWQKLSYWARSEYKVMLVTSVKQNGEYWIKNSEKKLQFSLTISKQTDIVHAMLQAMQIQSSLVVLQQAKNVFAMTQSIKAQLEDSWSSF